MPRETHHRVHRVQLGSTTFDLAEPLVFGRRPSAPRVAQGQTPKLVTVASRHGEVSSTHVEVRQEGGAVVVTDLRSTNGTRVTIPGRVPVSLRQGESIVVLVGTIVDIGDGNRLEILPLTRLIPQEDFTP